MVIRTYFDKNNTIISNSNVNTGLNPVAELFYGGDVSTYSRFIFQFDIARLRALYTGGTFTDLTKLTHTLRLTNTGSFDHGLLNGTMSCKERASSFDLIVFTIDQAWDNGVGYDYTPAALITGQEAFSNGPSNWIEARTGEAWTGGSGIYSGSSSGVTIATQHFDKGNENVEIDITDYVNGLLTGATNNGLGLAYATGFEDMSAIALQYVGFYTNNTQTFYEPFVESVYSNHITDDRNNFYLDKPNKLYLYVNLAGNPTNLDSIPSVNIYDQEDNLLSAYTSSQVTHVTKGVYSVDILVPTTGDNDGVMYTDLWTGITINGVSRPDSALNFVTKNALEYYSIGDNDMFPRRVAVNVSGIQNKERIKAGEVRKVIVSARIPYTVEQTQYLSSLRYRVWVSEGSSQLTVIDFQPVELANNYYYFLLDVASLLPNTYYLDIEATSNDEVTVLNQVLQFEVVNQVDKRKSQ